MKIEFRLDLRFIYKKYRFNVYYEHELVNNIGFVENKQKNSNVFWFGVENNLSTLIPGFLK